MILRRLSLVALLAAPWMVTYLMPRPILSPPSLVWWTTHALNKVRPDENPPHNIEYAAHLSAARNEFEPFQIVLRAESQTFQDVDVQASPLQGPGKSVIGENNITVYLEKFIDVRNATPGGAAGEWPDALIPRVDRYAGEKRNAFPFRLEDHRNQPIWIEVYVPPDTAPGTYAGKVTIAAAGITKAVVPVSLQVWSFTLPSTSSFPTTFGFSGMSAVRQHFGRYTNDDDVYKLTAIYGKALLWHRISMYGGSMTPPAVLRDRDGIHIQWDRYDNEVGPFLDGTLIRPGEPLRGAKATTVELRMSNAVQTPTEKIAYLREFAGHFRQKGWFDRLFNYLRDEPVRSDFPAMLNDARLVHAADPSLKNLVTAPLHPEWHSLIDIWTPLVNCFETKQDQGFCDPMAGFTAYAGERAEGKKLWWYQSCASHGCAKSITGRGSEYFRGWPTYVIDASGVANRIMPWEAWKYDIGGELYFSTNEAYARGTDPWSDLFLFNGNGEGTLLYPGTPSKIGGRTDIPIESIRLKLIREGLEDYEYLHLLSQKNGSTAAAIAGTLVRRTYDFNTDPAALYAAREKIGQDLNSRN